MKTEIKVPAVGESITEATISEWNKHTGDYVDRDEVLLVLETDKASVEVVAEQAGELTTQHDEGDVVEVGATLGFIDTDVSAPASDGKETKAESETSASSTESETSASATESKTSASTPPPTPSSPPPKAASTSSNGGGSHHDNLSPAVRKIVAERGVDPSTISGSGKGGRITKADALTATPASAPPPEQKAPTPIPSLPTLKDDGVDEVTREKMTSLRKTIARRLVEAQQTAAILTTFNEIDMTAAMELRKKYKEAFKEKYGISLGFMGLFTKAACEALKEFPRVNASIEGEEIIYHNYVNMGIAVSTEKGLLVPAIRNADRLSLAEIELSVRHYALKARDGKISVDDLAGGTFTISNGGVFGSLMSTPILNPPQSGILGLHKIEERPVAVNGQVVVRPMMYVALSYDHRMVDGKESVSFLVKIKEGLEDPSRLLLEI